MIRNDGAIPADLMPHFDLWFAVLSLMIEDGRDYVRLGAKETNYRRPAYEDLMATGPMTRRLARFCNLEPEFVTTQFKRYVERDQLGALAA